MRKLLFNLHLILALAAGVFILILGVTGSIMAFEPELDHLMHWTLWHVEPGARALSLAEIAAVVSKAFPGEPIAGYTVSTSPDLSYQVALKRGAVYVNQYTGDILGVRSPGPDLLSRVHQLHLRLGWQQRSDAGKTIMSWAGVIILFLLISGLYLWWPLKRVSVQRGSTGRLVWFDTHNTTGIFSLVFLFVLSSTGIVIGFDDTLVALLYKVTHSKPAEAPKPPAAPQDGKPISPDRAMEIARAAIPGAIPFMINVPGRNGTYFVRSRYPEDLTPGGRSRVIVDQYTGPVLFSESSRTAPAGTRLVILNRAIHTGDIYGLATKALFCAASLTLVVQLITGVVMWGMRLRTRPRLSTLPKTLRPEIRGFPDTTS